MQARAPRDTSLRVSCARARDAPLTTPRLRPLRPLRVGSQERNAWVGLAEATKRMRVVDKRRTSQVKQNRARVDY